MGTTADFPTSLEVTITLIPILGLNPDLNHYPKVANVSKLRLLQITEEVYLIRDLGLTLRNNYFYTMGEKYISVVISFSLLCCAIFMLLLMEYDRLLASQVPEDQHAFPYGLLWG